jgi:exosome complex RNA-binding protein Csl4
MVISDKTKVSLYSALSALMVIVGIAVAYTRTDAKAEQALIGIREVKQDSAEQFSAQFKILLEVRDRVIRIESKIQKRGD